MSSKKTSSSQSMSDKLPADGGCPRCGGWLREEVIIDENFVRHNVRTCVQCGNCLSTEATTQKEFPSRPLPRIHSPRTLAKPSKSIRKKATHIVLRKVPIPNLSPPPVPRTDEDWNGVYQVQCRTFAGYQHFRERAAFYRAKTKSCSTKIDKLSTDYRARLCENLSDTLGQLYSRQGRKALRDVLRRSQRVNHAVSESDRTGSKLRDRYALLMLQAMSHLPDDPVVRTWRTFKTALGSWDYLRLPRKGFERGVKRPYRSPKEADIDTEIKAQQLEGKGPRKILRSLKNRAATWEAQRITHTNVVIKEGKWIIDNIHLSKVQPKPFSPSSIHTYQAIDKRGKTLKKTSDK